MDWLYILYIVGAAVWICGVLTFCRDFNNPCKTLIAGMLGIVWPIAALVTLLHIYYERN